MCVPQFVSDWGPAHNREENRKSIAHTRSVLTYGSWHVAHSSTHTTYKCDDAVRDWLVVRLGDDLEAWMDESSMLRRSFRNVAVIAGLIERRFPGEEKSRRQVTFSSDLIYDTLRQHEPNHILLRATRQDAAWQLADLKRLGDLLKRAKGRIVYRRLDRISPLAVPVLLEIGKERVLDGTAEDELLDIAAQELIDEATRL